MTRAHRCLLFLMVCSFVAATARAQVTPGTPPFGSFGGGPDVIDLANLNSHFTAPVVHKSGRGMDFSYDLRYDSSVWYPVGISGNQSWSPTLNFGWTAQTQTVTGYIKYSYQPNSVNCTGSNGVHYIFNTYTNFVYYDSFNNAHTFSGAYYVFSFSQPPGYTPVYPCASFPTSFSSFSGDGSGLTLYASSSSAPTITTRAGAVIVPPVNSPNGSAVETDRNGNQISVNSTGVFTDTLGTTELTVAGGAPNPLTYTYTAPSGASASFRMSYLTYTVKTNFGCAGIAEYGPTSVSLVDKITLPDGSFYKFTYEATPGFAGDVTGRLASVALPTGGTISYAYSGGSNGITCADGSAATLSRSTPDGTWTYAQVKGTGAASTTTITDPLNNQTVVQFQGIYETQRQVYQGSAATGTLLKTVNTCYNGSASPCTGTAVALPITRRTTTIQLPNSTGKQSARDEFYNSYGLITEVDEYDYGSGTVGALIRKTLIAYASLGNGIVDRPSSVTVQDAGGVTKAQSTFAYDETAVTATSGTPQLVAVSGSRGNATTVKSYKDGTNYLTSKATYFDTGNVQTATDINNAQTTYTYGACGNSFPTSISEPLTLSKSLTWNCTGGVLTSSTDENGKQTTVAYSDAYFWRPASNSDPTNAVTNLTYTGQTSVESSLLFNSGNSAVDVLTTFDGLGRARVRQTRQAPGSANFDSVEQDYDSLGRPSRTTLPYNGTAGQLNLTAPATTKTYDALGRVLSVTNAGGGSTTYSYTQNDALVTIGPAPAGENTKRRQLEYDGLGRLTSACEITGATGSGTCGQTVSQTGYWTKYTYDVLGNLLTVTQNAQAAPGSQQSRSYGYDFLGRLTSETNPENGTTNYTYDTDTTCGTSSGDRMKRVDAVGNTSCFAYDALHRLTSVTYPSGTYSGSTPSKTFVYDSATVNGVAMTNVKARLAEAYTGPSSGKITDIGFSYTARGEVSDVYQSSPHSGGYYHVNQTYWPHGAPLQLSQLAGLPAISNGGTIGSTVGLDGEGRITQVTAGTGQNPVTGVNYNLYGTPPQTTVTFGSGDSDIFNYDVNTARMTQYQFNINGQSDTGALAWNANSTLQKLVITNAFNSADSQTCNYGYDDMVRIASANCGTAANQTFSYDPFGNINKSGSPYSFQPNYNTATNHITTVGGFTATYDANGNVTNDGVHTYSWDADGNSITLDGTGLTFDAFDRAVEKNVSGTYTEIIYSPTGAKLALMSGQTLQRAFVSLPGKATAVYTSAGLDHYRHSDWLGSARLTSSPSRTVLSTTAYAPFGESYAQSGTADLSFTGQNQDTVGGDYDFMYREYSIQGRWPSPDPAGLASAHRADPRSWNRYAYVRNNPLGLVDPLGLDCVYLNDSGTGVDENGVDTQSNQSECAKNGGFWGDGSLLGITIDSNSNNVDVYTIYSDPNGFVGLELTHNQAYSPGGQTWQAGPIMGSLDSNWSSSPSSLAAGLNALHQAGVMAGAAVNGKNILLWYGASAAVGGIGVATGIIGEAVGGTISIGGTISSGLQSLYFWGLSNAYSLAEFVGGFSTPYAPTTLPAALGYAGGYLQSCHTPGQTCH